MNPTLLNEQLNATYHRRKAFDWVVRYLLLGAAIVALIPLFSVLGYVLLKGVPGLNLSFFTEVPKPVGEVGGGMANALAGTLLLVVLASLVGIIWGIATGIFLSEYGQGKTGTVVRFQRGYARQCSLHGHRTLCLCHIVHPMRRFSALAGGVALGLIMIPTVARTTEEMLKLVPTHIREAGLALGLPRWKVILRLVLRGCLGGITTGIMLAVARVAGETAPLLFTALGNQYWSHSLIEPMASLPVQIYTYAISPFDDWHTKAWAGALVLVLVVFAINITTRMFLKRDSAGRE